MANLRNLPDEYLMCRFPGVRHHWAFVGLWRAFGVVFAVSRCDRCETVKENQLRTDGTHRSTRYVYPEDYTIPGGAFAPEVRREMMRRVKPTVDTPPTWNDRRRPPSG